MEMKKTRGCDSDSAKSSWRAGQKWEMIMQMVGSGGYGLIIYMSDTRVTLNTARARPSPKLEGAPKCQMPATPTSPT
eukprot:scaffold20763_cov116-Isochrysis_galbana.AAC.2